jgi:hypothetical protein
MSKIYFEMNGKEKQLNHIADNLDYAICMFGEGLRGTGEYNISNKQVYELEKRIGCHLLEAYKDVMSLLKAVEEKDDYLPEE